CAGDAWQRLRRGSKNRIRSGWSSFRTRASRCRSWFGTVTSTPLLSRTQGSRSRS
ncbi:MAG: hypothetical protein AVDCRST_MAG71-1740, partial [uncultured Lysobacter sp.]